MKKNTCASNNKYIEKRKSIRTEVNWEVHVDLSGDASLSNSINVSKGGILIHSPVKMDSGSFINLSIEIQINGERKLCQASGEVIESRQSDSAYDVAVKFTKVDDALSAYISGLI